MAEATKYEGSCHCGEVRYTVTADLTSLMTCNCSICHRTGVILSFVPQESFQLVAGEQAQTDYQFGKKNLHHLFCKTCGVRSYATGMGPHGRPMVAINARCLSGVDAAAMPAKQYDGKSR